MSDKSDIDWDRLENEHVSEDGPMPVIISNDMLAKRLVWDVVPCKMAVDIAKRLGLEPASADVEEMEHTESHARLDAVQPLAQVVHTLVRHASGAAVHGLLKANDVEIEEEDVADMIDRTTATSFMITAGVLAELIDLDLLHKPHYPLLVGTVTE